jgi:hypothetical protein
MSYYDRISPYAVDSSRRDAVLDSRYELGFRAAMKGEARLTKRQAGFYGLEFDFYVSGYKAAIALKK